MLQQRNTWIGAVVFAREEDGEALPSVTNYDLVIYYIPLSPSL
jgi:hypothetical protein